MRLSSWCYGIKSMYCSGLAPRSVHSSRHCDSLESHGVQIVLAMEVEPLVLPARSPHLNSYAERWVRSVKEEGLYTAILFGERSLRHALSEYVKHFHAERNHQGKGNVLLFPRDTDIHRSVEFACSPAGPLMDVTGKLWFWELSLRTAPRDIRRLDRVSFWRICTILAGFSS